MCGYAWSSRHTAQAPIPAPSPSQPRCSVVVAFTPTWSTETPRARARFSRIASRCGQILGSWAAMVQVRIHKGIAALTGIGHHAAEQHKRIRPLISRVVIGKELADVTPAARTEDRVGEGMGEHIGIGVAESSPLLCGMSTPPMIQRSTLHQTMHVVSVSYAQHGNPPFSLRAPAAAPPPAASPRERSP